MLVSNVENGKNGPFSDSDLKKIVTFLELSKEEERQLYKRSCKGERETSAGNANIYYKK